MSLIDDIMKDAKGVEARLLGPDYKYYANIKTPKELGMSDKGTTDALVSDISGLTAYVELLVSGKSKASMAGGKPMGNKFFLQTGAKCMADDSGQEVDRYIYVNNVPQGNIPFISSGMGVNFSEAKGLIPGMMSDLNVLNPFNIMRAFAAGSTPPCKKITMETIDTNNNKSNAEHYVATVDINSIDPCTFPKLTNPMTGDRCRETYVNVDDENINQLYLLTFSVISVYLLYKLSKL